MWEKIHLIWECDLVKALWSTTPFANKIDAGPMLSFKQWLQEMMHKLEIEQAELALALAWKLWCARNQRVWEGDDQGPEMIQVEIVAWLPESKKAKPIKQCEVPKCSAQQWVRPPPGRWKVNVDAATEKGRRVAGGVAVIQDEFGMVKACFNSKLHNITEPRMAEALALKEAVLRMREVGINGGIIELDCKEVIAIEETQQEKEAFTESQLILADVELLCLAFNFLNFNHVKRNVNVVVS